MVLFSFADCENIEKKNTPALECALDEDRARAPARIIDHKTSPGHWSAIGLFVTECMGLTESSGACGFLEPRSEPQQCLA